MVRFLNLSEMYLQLLIVKILLTEVVVLVVCHADFVRFQPIKI